MVIGTFNFLTGSENASYIRQWRTDRYVMALNDLISLLREHPSTMEIDFWEW